MKLAIYYPRALSGDGGVTLSVRGWATACAAAGVEVVVICSEGAKALDGVEVRLIKHRGRGRLQRPVGLGAAVRDVDLAWLHSGWVGHNVDAARTLRRLGVPYIVTPHGAYDPRVFARRRVAKALWWRLFEHRLLRDAAAVHVFFESEVGNLRSAGFGGATIEVPNGVAVPAAPRWDGGSSGVILWLGRYDVEHKGLDLLVDAVARIPPSSRPRIRLHGPESRDKRSTVTSLATNAGVADFIEARPPIYGVEKTRALDTAVAFVYPSRWDSHSIAMLEALSRGVPLITTSSTQLGPLLDAEGAAFVADPSPDSIADALQRSCTHRAHEVGRRGHALAVARFGWPASGLSMKRQLEELTRA